MDNFNTSLTEKTTNEWLTPPYIVQALGPFDLDPCAPRRNARPWATAAFHFSGPRDMFDDPADQERQCGLQAPWHGRVWLNPPYGDNTFAWMQKMALHRRGVALIFARTDTQGFHDEVFKKAHALFFFEGRLSFYRIDGTQGDGSGAPSCLVSYDSEETNIIIAASDTGKIRGKLVIL